MFLVMNHAVIASQLLGIEILTFNYKKWKRDIEITLGLLDTDIPILEPKLTIPEEGSFAVIMSKYKK